MLLKEIVNDMLEFYSEIKLKKAHKAIEERDPHDLFYSMGEFFYGMGIRNGLSLWSDASKPLRQDIWNDMTAEEQDFFNDHWGQYGEIYQGENMHADDASMVIIDRFCRALKEKYDEHAH